MREGAEEKPVHHAEDGGIRANSERNDQDGGSKEAGVAAKSSRGETNVLPDCFESH
jgi:hypothetical protein